MPDLFDPITIGAIHQTTDSLVVPTQSARASRTRSHSDGRSWRTRIARRVSQKIRV